jgi:hypothetical protein
MRSCRIKRDANHNVNRDEETSSAKKRPQKLHFSPHPLLDACDLGRPCFQRSSHRAELVASQHTPPADLVAPTPTDPYQHKRAAMLCTIVPA